MHLPLLGQNQGKSEEIKPKSFSYPQDIPTCHTVKTLTTDFTLKRAGNISLICYKSHK